MTKDEHIEYIKERHKLLKERTKRKLKRKRGFAPKSYEDLKPLQIKKWRK